jgi:hypothetical protein
MNERPLGRGADRSEAPDKVFTKDRNPSPHNSEQRHALCERCGLYPRMDRHICGACLGREILGFASREEQAAAFKAGRR